MGAKKTAEEATENLMVEEEKGKKIAEDAVIDKEDESALASMTLKHLKTKAKDLGMSADDIEECDDSDDPKQSIISLILDAKQKAAAKKLAKEQEDAAKKAAEELAAKLEKEKEEKA